MTRAKLGQLRDAQKEMTVQGARRKTGRQGGDQPVNDQLLNEIKLLKQRVAVLEAKRPATEAPEVIVLRTIGREEAKQEIQKMFESGEVLYYSDISRQLRLDLPSVVEICSELIREGEVEVATDLV